MKTKTLHYLQVDYTHANGNRTFIKARTVSVNMDRVTITGRDDPSETITVPFNDVHAITKKVVTLEA
jgi:hypothetical protein